MSTPSNKGEGPSLQWAWRLIDGHRAGRRVTQHQIDFALEAIERVTGRRPSSGTHYDDEGRLRNVSPRG